MVGLVGETMVGSLPIVEMSSGCVKWTCMPNSNSMGWKLPKLSHFFNFWLVGSSGRSAWKDFHETFIFKVPSIMVWTMTHDTNPTPNHSPRWSVYSMADKNKTTAKASLCKAWAGYKCAHGSQTGPNIFMACHISFESWEHVDSDPLCAPYEVFISLPTILNGSFKMGPCNNQFN